MKTKGRNPLGLLIATFGPPGSGKSTLCNSLAGKLKVATVSPGRELRRLAARGGPVGKEAQRIIRLAAPAPDTMLWWMLTEHGARTLILDGAPQNVSQISLLANFATQYCYRLVGIHLLLSTDLALERIASRWYCSKCRKPVLDGEPGCSGGATHYRRFDDTVASTVTARIQRYERDVLPAAACFAELFEYREFDGSNNSQETLTSVSEWIESLGDDDT